MRVDAPAQASGRSRRTRAHWLLLGALLLGAVAFCSRSFVNASDFNSDNAVVGLQARHILRGEWSWFLWGTDYQSSLDAALIALGFASFGATPLVMMAVTFTGHLIVIALAFDILARRTRPLVAAVATLPLVIAPSMITAVALAPPRQWALTAVFLALWLLDRASDSRRAWLGLAAGGAILMLALYLDLFTIQFALGGAVFGVLACFDGQAGGAWRRRLVALVAGGLLGAIPVVLVQLYGPAGHEAQASGSLAMIPHNLEMLLGECLPRALSYATFVPGKGLYPDRWDGGAFQILQIGGALIFVGALVIGALLAVEKGDLKLRRLGILGAIIVSGSIAAFLISSKIQDLFAVRYLSPVILGAPFVLAPLAARVGAMRLGLLLVPYLVSTAVASWLPALRSPDRLPGSLSTRRGLADDELELRDFLRAHNVNAAAAQYWLAYRLTFLFSEWPVVVPLDPNDDRYPPFHDAFAVSPALALIFHPDEPRARPGPYEAELQRKGMRYTRSVVAGYTVFVVEKP